MTRCPIASIEVDMLRRIAAGIAASHARIAAGCAAARAGVDRATSSTGSRP